LQSQRAEVSALSDKLQKTQHERTDAERAVGELREELNNLKVQTQSALRSKGKKDKELKDLEDRLADLVIELEQRREADAAAAAQLEEAKEALKNDKLVLEHSSKDAEKIRRRAEELTDELSTQIRSNRQAAEELNDLQKEKERLINEERTVRKEIDRTAKLVQLAQEKATEASQAEQAAEAELDEVKAALEAAERAMAAERRAADGARTHLEALRREHDVLQRGLARAGDKSQEAAEAIALQGQVKAGMERDVRAVAAVLSALKFKIVTAEEERQQAEAEQEAARRTLAETAEALKLQELQAAALQRRVDEAAAKLTGQQSLFEGVKQDRNHYSKALQDAQNEMSEMKRTFRVLVRSIEALKEDITAKDAGLVKEHFERHKLDKEKEALRSDVARIQRQVQSCEQILLGQEQEMSKLNAIIAEADAEKSRQEKEYAAVVTERGLLQAQLMKRDSELTELYEQLRIQKSALANGAAAFAKLAAERDDLATRIASLKGELLVAQTQTGDGKALEVEVKRLEADLLKEQTKVASLSDQLDRPLHIHRWRELADRDPEKWAFLQRVQQLQKRSLEAQNELKAREALLAEKQKEYTALQSRLEREPGPDVAETIEKYRASIKTKTKQLRALEAELQTYREAVKEYKDDVQRVDRTLDDLNSQFLRKQKQQMGRTGGGGGGGGGGGATLRRGDSFADAGPSLGSLLDGASELMATGGELRPVTSSGRVPTPQLLPKGTTVDSVKQQADRILAAYADLLGPDDSAASISTLSPRPQGADGGAWAVASGMSASVEGSLPPPER
jgi:chromosome segregation ATPase